MVIFFFIAFGLYIVGNLYMFVRGYQLLEILGKHRIWYSIVFWITALSFIVAQILRMTDFSDELLRIVFLVGSFWIAIMLYVFLITLGGDFLRLFTWIFGIRFNFRPKDYLIIKAVLFGIVLIVVSVILVVGYNNAKRPQTTHLRIPLDKSAGALTELRVVMISDVHLGLTYTQKDLARIVDVINEQNPDIVMLVGDIFDGDPKPVINDDMGVEFSRIQSKYGTYMSIGNHEYIGEREQRYSMNTGLKYLKSHGVQTLVDSVAFVNRSFYVVGRKDLMGGERKTIPELLQGVNTRLPIIMLDHQPYLLSEVEEAGVDLQLSGHTHHGQMWPLNYITGLLFEQDWGFLQKGKSNFYVSCGVGAWGPPVRTAGYSEVVVIDLIFNTN